MRIIMLNSNDKELLSKALNSSFFAKSEDDLNSLAKICKDNEIHLDIFGGGELEPLPQLCCIFQGAGVDSVVQNHLLHQRLEYALSLLSGIQQGGTPKEIEYTKCRMQAVILDIEIALGLKEVPKIDKEAEKKISNEIDVLVTNW